MPAKTIRHYESIGLIPSARRTGNGYRVYDVAPAESDALERAFAGRIVAVQVAAPHASFLAAYLGDVVEIR